MANHDTWNACQDHGKIMARSWQDNHGLSWFCQGYHVKNLIEPFSVIVRVLVEI